MVHRSSPPYGACNQKLGTARQQRQRSGLQPCAGPAFELYTVDRDTAFQIDYHEVDWPEKSQPGFGICEEHVEDSSIDCERVDGLWVPRIEEQNPIILGNCEQRIILRKSDGGNPVGTGAKRMEQ